MLTASLLMARPTTVGTDSVSDVAVKAAFVINFAKFTEWPVMAAGIPIVLCVAGDDGLVTALNQLAHGHDVSGHSLTVLPSHDTSEWHVCHVLFISDRDIRRPAPGLSAISALPVLTVSDAKGFTYHCGIHPSMTGTVTVQ